MWRHCDVHFVHTTSFKPHGNLMKRRSRILKPKFNGLRQCLESEFKFPGTSKSSQVWGPQVDGFVEILTDEETKVQQILLSNKILLLCLTSVTP